MRTRILLTGAATLVGAEIMRELLKRPDIESIVLLTSKEGGIGLDLRRLQTYLGPLPPAVRTLDADFRLPLFGLSEADWEELAASFDLALHCAQRETKDNDLRSAREANVHPVESWIKLLTRNPDLRLHHLSTAFVGGRRQGLFTEFDLDCGQDFHNAWERSKFEAEVRLRESSVSDRVTIYRPSHTLGRSDTGEAFQLAGAYPLLATLARASVLSGDPRARIDLIPADYVAESAVALACSGATGTFHLVSGWGASQPVGEVASAAAKGHGRSRRTLLLPRGIAWPLRLIGVGKLRDMLHQGPVFDSYLADRALGDLGITRPPASTWLERSVSRAAQRNWATDIADNLGSPLKESQQLSPAEIGLTDNEAFCDKR